MMKKYTGLKMKPGSWRTRHKRWKN